MAGYTTDEEFENEINELYDLAEQLILAWRWMPSGTLVDPPDIEAQARHAVHWTNQPAGEYQRSEPPSRWRGFFRIGGKRN